MNKWYILLGVVPNTIWFYNVLFSIPIHNKNIRTSTPERYVDITYSVFYFMINIQ